MRSPRVLAFAVCGLALAGGIAWLATRPPVPRFDQPSKGRFHVRPLGERDALRALGLDLPWKQTGYEIALPSQGTLRIELLDRAKPLWQANQARPAGVLRLCVGLRRVEASEVRTEHPEQLEAEAARLQGGGFARDFFAWRAVWTFRPAAAGAPPERGEVGGMLPRESAPPKRAEIGSGRLWVQNALGYQVRPAGERLLLQDWVALPIIFKPFQHRYQTLPIDVEWEGEKIPIADAPDPIYRVAITWTP